MAKFPPAGNTISSSNPGPSAVEESQDTVFDQLMTGARSVAGEQMAETKDVRMISNVDHVGTPTNSGCYINLNASNRIVV